MTEKEKKSQEYRNLVPAEMLVELKKLAAGNERSVAAEIRVAIRAYLDEQDEQVAA